MATMAPSNIGYSLREAMHHFKRNFGTTFGAIVTIFLSLFIIGTFVFLSALVDNMVGNVEDKVTIQAYLADDASQDAVDALQMKIEGWDNVESVTYKSKDEALEEYKATMSNKNAEDAVAALDGTNPVPASLVIKLNDPQEVENVANKLIDDSGFASIADDSDPANSVQYGRETVERLFMVTSYIRIIAIVLVVLLTFVAFVFINNTIRLSISARRREIGIERLVGASNSFIRGPFVAEEPPRHSSAPCLQSVRSRPSSRTYCRVSRSRWRSSRSTCSLPSLRRPMACSSSSAWQSASSAPLSQ